MLQRTKRDKWKEEVANPREVPRGSWWSVQSRFYIKWSDVSPVLFCETLSSYLPFLGLWQEKYPEAVCDQSSRVKSWFYQVASRIACPVLRINVIIFRSIGHVLSDRRSCSRKLVTSQFLVLYQVASCTVFFNLVSYRVLWIPLIMFRSFVECGISIACRYTSHNFPVL